MSTTRTLDRADVETLAASLTGRVLQTDDDDYEEARRVHNGLIDRRPALIVRCRTAADVAEAIRFARCGRAWPPRSRHRRFAALVRSVVRASVSTSAESRSSSCS